MDPNAVQKIADLAVEAAGANKIFLDNILDLQPLVLDPRQGPVSLERWAKNRHRFRGQFSTSTLSEFVAYVKRHAGQEPEIFVDADKASATAIFNMGTPEEPGHCDWTGHLTLAPSAAFAALERADSNHYTQRSLVNWVEDWTDCLSAKHSIDGDTYSIHTALVAIRELKISQIKDADHTDKDFGASRSVFEEIEAKSKSGQLPSHLVFRCAPYAGFDTREFNLRLGVQSGQGDIPPCLTLRVVGMKSIAEDIAREFKASLIEEIGSAAQVTIGTFNPGH